MIKPETIKSIDYNDIPEDIYMTITQGEGCANDTQFTYYVGCDCFGDDEEAQELYRSAYRKADQWFMDHGAEWNDTITIKVSW